MPTTSSLKNVNFMSQSKYDSIEPSDEELYATESSEYINTIIDEKKNKYDYTARITINKDTQYTAEFTGLLWVFGEEGYNPHAITINGKSFNWIYHYGSGYSSGECQVPIHKGDVFKIAGCSGAFSAFLIPKL